MANETWLDDLLGYKTIATTGPVEYPQRARLLLLGSGVAVADDPVTKSTVVTFTGGGGGAEGSVVGLKLPVRVATTGPITRSGLFTIDDVPLNDGDRVLVKDQLVASENGLFIAGDVAWVRTEDADTDLETPSMILVPVSEGTENGRSVWMLTSTDPLVLDVSPLEFQKVGSGDASSLRGVPLEADVGAPDADDVLAFDGDGYVARKLSNASIAPNAAIAAAKLAAGANGQVLRTVGGVPAWQTLSPADLGENAITAPTITASQNNYAPAGWSTASVVRLATDAPGHVIRGFGPATVRRKTVVLTGVGYLDLEALAGGQVAGNQLADGSSARLYPGYAVELLYDMASFAWRVVGISHVDVPRTWAHEQRFNASPRLLGATELLFDTPRVVEKMFGPHAGRPVYGGMGFAPSLEHLWQMAMVRDPDVVDSNAVWRWELSLPEGCEVNEFAITVIPNFLGESVTTLQAGAWWFDAEGAVDSSTALGIMDATSGTEMQPLQIVGLNWPVRARAVVTVTLTSVAGCAFGPLYVKYTESRASGSR